MMVKFPEHEKLKKIVIRSQECGCFVDWLLARGFRITNKHRAIRFNLQRDLAAYFDIDEAKLEAERRAMLDELRKVQHG